jgi:hypothetical protein
MTMSRLVLASAFLAFAMAPVLSAQAAVEAGLGAARAATMSGPASKAGSAISGLANTLDKTLKTAQPEASSTGSAAKSPARKSATAAPAAAAVPAAPAAPAKVYEDPLQIATGMTYDELVTRFGPPAMIFGTGVADGKLLTYTGKSGAIQVECESGKVSSVTKPKA